MKISLEPARNTRKYRAAVDLAFDMGIQMDAPALARLEPIALYVVLQEAGLGWDAGWEAWMEIELAPSPTPPNICSSKLYA